MAPRGESLINLYSCRCSAYAIAGAEILLSNMGTIATDSTTEARMNNSKPIGEARLSRNCPPIKPRVTVNM